MGNKKWEVLAYAEMVKQDGFFQVWYKSMVNRKCIKCHVATGEAAREESVTGLCSVCENKMTIRDRQAFTVFFESHNGKDVQGVPAMLCVNGERAAHDGRCLGKELLKRDWVYRKGFFEGLKETIVETIKTDIVIV
ncbi:MAG: hypothetical protein PHG63_03730 [Candidatus Dojkabacteria bacterium]|nr:hypothetical protein [Candidatus Dojkabacteria bacterium]